MWFVFVVFTVCSVRLDPVHYISLGTKKIQHSHKHIDTHTIYTAHIDTEFYAWHMFVIQVLDQWKERSRLYRYILRLLRSGGVCSIFVASNSTIGVGWLIMERWNENRKSNDKRQPTNGMEESVSTRSTRFPRMFVRGTRETSLVFLARLSSIHIGITIIMQTCSRRKFCTRDTKLRAGSK